MRKFSKIATLGVACAMMASTAAFAGGAAPAVTSKDITSNLIPGKDEIKLYAGANGTFRNVDAHMNCQGGCGPDDRGNGSSDKFSGALFGGARLGLGEHHARQTFLQIQLGYYLMAATQTALILADFHPPAGHDASLRIAQRGFLMAGLGMMLCQLHGWTIDGVVGAKAVQVEADLRVRENGPSTHISKDKTAVGPVLELNASQGNLIAGAYVTHMQGMSIGGQSTGVPGFDYQARTDDETTFGFKLGLGF